MDFERLRASLSDREIGPIDGRPPCACLLYTSQSASGAQGKAAADFLQRGRHQHPDAVWRQEV